MMSQYAKRCCCAVTACWFLATLMGAHAQTDKQVLRVRELSN